MRQNRTSVLVALGLAVCLPAAVSAQPTTVSVDCTDPDPAEHDSITEALEEEADELIIVIDGICKEDFVIRRDFVTLRGKNQNPDLDGIHSATPGMILGGTGGLEIGESVVTVRGGKAIRFEDLFIGEGQANRSGVAAIDGSIVTISNCRVENNPGFGVAAGNAVLFVVDSTVRGNSGFGGFSVSGGHLRLTDSFLLDNGRGLLSVDNGLITMIGGSLNERIISSRNSSVDLGGFDVFGVPLAGVPHTGTFFANFILGNSSIRVFSGSTLQGLTLVSDFSTVVLRAGGTLDGDLSCSSGGDAFCDPASNVTGASDCGLCCTDGDGDGFLVGGCGGLADCDDGNFDVNPSATEVCDGVDNDCDGEIDEGGVCP